MTKQELSSMSLDAVTAHIDALRKRKEDHAKTLAIATSDAGKALLDRRRRELAAIREGYHNIVVDRDATAVVRDLVVRITMDRQAMRDIEWLEKSGDTADALDAELAAAHEVKADKEAAMRRGR